MPNTATKVFIFDQVWAGLAIPSQLFRVRGSFTPTFVVRGSEIVLYRVKGSDTGG